MDEIIKILLEIKIVEEKFRKTQENSALYGFENGMTSEEIKILDKIINLIGEVNLAADTILKRV